MDASKLHGLKLRDIKITDKFWSRYTNLVADVIIPYQWDILNDRIAGAEESHCLKNFRIAAGEESGSFGGAVFQDTDAYKWLEAVAFSLETNPDEKLESIADDVINLIIRAQQSDGYINTYYTVAEKGKRWSNLVEGHELYSAGHLLEAAVAYSRATGKNAILDAACRFADLICEVFGNGEGQIHGYCGHPEIELALVKLYHATGRERYLETAKFFIDTRGSLPNYFLEEIKSRNGDSLHADFKNYDLKYAQAHMPLRAQRTAEGHAVRAMYLYAAMADIASEYRDEALMQACEAIWENIVRKRLYVTGSVGSSGLLERFTTDYDLPNDANYSETCASIGLVFFASRMAAVKHDARYMDIAEKALYNTILAGINLQGDRYFYVNPLEVWPACCMENTARAHVKPVRQRWFSVACCPTNVARTLASLGQYIYSQNDDTVYINLYIENKAESVVNGVRAQFDLRSGILTDGKSTLTVETKEPAAFTVALRIPEYVKKYSFAINGSPVEPVIQQGYALFTNRWEGRTEIAVDFQIPAEFLAAHPEVRADAGKVAMVKGPLVYCLEEADNGKNLSSIFVHPRQSPVPDFEAGLLGGTPVLTCTGKRISVQNWDGELYKPAEFITEAVNLKAVPYCLWGNREPGEMAVWLKASI